MYRYRRNSNFSRKREGQKNVGNDLKLFQQNVEANGRRISENCLGEILQKQSATNLRGSSKVRFTHGLKIKNYLNFNLRGIHDEKKMFFRRTIVIRYVLNHIALFVLAFLVAIFSLEFGLAMSYNITFHDIMKDTGTWFSEFFLQHLDDHILIIFDSIAIVSLS